MKNDYTKALKFLLVKNMTNHFSHIKISTNRDYSSQNYGPSNVLFRFTDLWVSHLN